MNRKRNTAKQVTTNVDDLLSALKLILIEKKSIRSVSTMFRIPKSSIHDYIKKLKTEIPDLTQMSDEQLKKRITTLVGAGPPTVNNNKLKLKLDKIFIYGVFSSF